MVEPSDSTIIILEGDQTGQDLLLEAVRVLHPDVVRLPLEFEYFDLSLENRRVTSNRVIHEAAEAIRRTGLGLKTAPSAFTGEVIRRVGHKLDVWSALG